MTVATVAKVAVANVCILIVGVYNGWAARDSRKRLLVVFAAFKNKCYKQGKAMQGRTFNQIRAQVNAHLSSKHKKNYQKTRTKCLYKLLSHCVKQTNIDLDIPPLKHKQARSILNKWIDSGFSYQELEIQLRTEIANRNAMMSDKLGNNGELKGLQGDVHQSVISSLPSNKFYKSPEWRKIRYEALKESGNVCQCCGASPKVGARIHVDHIKPRSIFPELALDKENLQILCEDCNLGKSNLHQDDWRGE